MTFADLFNSYPPAPPRVCRYCPAVLSGFGDLCPACSDAHGAEGLMSQLIRGRALMLGRARLSRVK